MKNLPAKLLSLVLGPVKSGKSEWAELLATSTGKPVTYVATAELAPEDQEWQARIERHRQRRPANWITIEVPKKLPTTILTASAGSCLLVDSLGNWVANLLDLDDATWERVQQDFLQGLQQTTADVILVAEETGWGVVPAYPLGRIFRERLGNLVRFTGTLANPVYLVTGGHVLNLSVLGQPLPF
ncbi:MAG: bifunctional adenosylcobinamide kinase/adenosylcobinamide-phosphate guanylyltransferase [Oscillatoriaceae bacterium SKW80]|nr:bifunctional adenosylcobinamide kinase/adenosylcobinamide-phosphate guanylyltransferase [Oscillatoriaceae bacterium SKYG93]MCX8121346.1 bifunctional adenosylcobinamide kinase/adenosylcobinamide-phosphate guanylyltransferase [Oscillatoriaceae bacterium SKW80]MDW8451978.1 bifunctional adenosylcobinamide kinase/adenosylcobinamide-phosphate guanylyltransferase [Oscillatoriaceae cyanobacterium SKYGB_i_bin93]HIK29520.1 bifunctional adenosylcobinamide kinase/adenosylcobinamide-phosphate guanylyltran